MANINQQITQGIGTPSGIKFFILLGLSPSAAGGGSSPTSSAHLLMMGVG